MGNGFAVTFGLMVGFGVGDFLITFGLAVALVAPKARLPIVETNNALTAEIKLLRERFRIRILC
ncbi:MAG: hypothetical protein WCO85_05880 [Actinomycetes bacterium]